MKYLLVFLLVICSAEYSAAQNLSVEETIVYINEKLANNIYVAYNGEKTNEQRKSLYQISITTDGYLIVINKTEGWKTKIINGKKRTDKIQYEKELKIKISDIDTTVKMKSYFDAEDKFKEFIMIKCKGTFSNKCIVVKNKETYPVAVVSTDFAYSQAINFPKLSNIGINLCNAFEYLFRAVLHDSKYKPKPDPKDPFAPK